MLARLFNRPPRRRFLVEFSPFQVLIAGVTHAHRGPLTLDCAAEFARDDVTGIERWIDEHTERRKSWTPAVCSLVTPQGVLQRETVQPRRLVEPEYLPTLVRDAQRRRSMSSAPFTPPDLNQWKLRAVSAYDGTPLLEDAPATPALISGVPAAEAEKVRAQLAEWRVNAIRMESGLLSLVGVVHGALERRHDLRAAVIFVIHEDSTAIHILGKEGVHTPAPVPHGLSLIRQQVKREFDLKDPAEVRARLENPDEELRKRASRLLRSLGNDLKPAIDSYEMTTGQPVGDIHFACLPSHLGWIAEPLSRIVGRALFTLEPTEWLPQAGVQLAGGLPAFGANWLGALSLVANLPAAAGPASDKVAVANAYYQRAWHVDSQSGDLGAGRRAVGRAFLAHAAAAGLALAAVTVTGWQLYVSRALRADTAYWEKQMADNRPLFDAQMLAGTRLREQTAKLDHAAALMQGPYRVSDFLMNLGRTLPARMRIDRIEANDSRVAISGSLLEPAEEASNTLGAYLDALRRTAGIGPLFSSISITSLQREPTGDALAFEITLRLRESAP